MNLPETPDWCKALSDDELPRVLRKAVEEFISAQQKLDELQNEVFKRKELKLCLKSPTNN